MPASFTDDAYTLGDGWNREFTEQLDEVTNLLVSGSMKRMKIFVMKNALIFAALEHRGNHKIEYEDVMNAIKLSEYNCTVVENLFGNFASSEHQRVCNRILELLKKTPMMSAKQVQNRMTWADIKDVDIAIDIMAKREIILPSKPNRTILYYVPKDDEI